MKKSIGKKLTLSKTTVANLGNEEMKEVKGGAISFWCWTGENCTYSCTGGAASRNIGGCVTGLCSALPECQ
jgi:natural product precursor